MALNFENIVQKLIDTGIESPRLEARLIIAAAKKVDCQEVSQFCELSAAEEQKITSMIDERLSNRPLDKILGHREFYKYDFFCNDDVLSPRPDTETLVEQAANLIFRHNLKNVLELGIGSGCVLLSLLADFPFLCGTGVDISPKALKVAKQNASRLGVENRTRLFCADWNNDNFIAEIGQKFDIIVSNPPYIPSTEISELAPEVREFDPLLALDGGESGFDAYEKISEISPQLLEDGGYLLFESGINQAQKIVEICEKNGFNLLHIQKDLAGIDRCVIAKKRGKK